MLLSLIERQMATHPGALAVVHGERRLTYRQLQQAAADTAHGLREAGVTEGSLVAVYLHRSPELLAALIAIWQVGAAYLPLDPAHPTERTGFMLEDSAAGFVLSETTLLESVPQLSARVLNLRSFAPGPLLPLSPEPLAATLAYVIYTSGSTGKPKGAMISHGSLANTIHGLQRDLQLRPSDVMLASNSFAFDISGQEMYLPLISGARIHLVERELAADGPALMQVLHDAGITIMMGLATTYRLLLAAGWPGNPDLQLTVGGEALSLELARLLAERSRALWNHYGPTETSICATSEKIEAGATRITLGRALENVSVYVLDEERAPVAQGAAGEIFIGGEGVGLGYLNRPELTAACFLPDPFSGRPGATMYKTGDLGALLEDGKLDFLGRADDQVKIRGFRIELREVEAALEDCSGVKAAIARAIEFGADDRRLIAFVVATETGDPALQADHLRAHLRQRLPAYMVPSEYLVLPAFPLLPSGKVDRRALDALRLQPVAATSDTVNDDIEAKLQSIWQTLFRVATVRLTDSFFDLGGHSLLAARMLVQVEKQLGAKVPVSFLAQHSTIAQLADYLRHQAKSPASLLVTLRAEGSRAPLFLAHGIGGSLLTFRELIAQLSKDQPIYGLRIPASLKELDAELPGAEPELDIIKRLATAYVACIRSRVPHGPYQLAGHSSAGLLVVEVAQQLRAGGSEVHLLALLDADIGQGPPRESPWKNWKALRNFLQRNVEELQYSYRYGLRELSLRKVNHYKRKFQVALVRHWPRVSRGFPETFITEARFALALHTFRPALYSGEVWNYVAHDEPRSHHDPTLGWRPQINGLLQTVTLPGGHQSLFVQPYVKALAAHLESRLHAGDGNSFQAVVSAPPAHAVHEQDRQQAGVPKLQSLGVQV